MMHIRKESKRGFIDLLSFSAVTNVLGQFIPAKHTVIIGEYGVGVRSIELSERQALRIIKELRA